jgi:hypothetical protein
MAEEVEVHIIQPETQEVLLEEMEEEEMEVQVRVELVQLILEEAEVDPNDLVHQTEERVAQEELFFVFQQQIIHLQQQVLQQLQQMVHLQF